MIREIQGFKIILDDKDSLGLKQNDVYDEHETQLIKKIVQPDHVVLDIGANIGYFTLLMSQVEGVHVYAFEPDPDNYIILQKNLTLNKVFNVHPYNFAMGDKHTEIDLNKCEFNRGMHRVYKSKWCTDGVIKVPMRTVDEVMNDIHVDFVKIDVEGSEFGVLKGMTNLIRNSHPTLLLEFHPPGIEEYGANPIHLFNFIRDFGYAIHLCGIHGHPDIPNISVDDLIIYTRNYPGRNILCVPK